MEESEVDPISGTVKCMTKNLDHVKVMRVEEHVTFQRMEDKCVSLLLIHIGIGLCRHQQNSPENRGSVHLKLWVGVDEEN